MKYSEIKEIKQKLRNNTTPAEKILWRHIRRRQLSGRKFLRQHAIVYDSHGDQYFFFVPDFYCEAELLAIELDGKIHDFQKGKDKNRDLILSEMGIRVLRIKNEELKDLSSVLEKVKSHFKRDDNESIFERKSYR